MNCGENLGGGGQDVGAIFLECEYCGYCGGNYATRETAQVYADIHAKYEVPEHR